MHLIVTRTYVHTFDEMAQTLSKCVGVLETLSVRCRRLNSEFFLATVFMITWGLVCHLVCIPIHLVRKSVDKPKKRKIVKEKM